MNQIPLKNNGNYYKQFRWTLIFLNFVFETHHFEELMSKRKTSTGWRYVMTLACERWTSVDWQLTVKVFQGQQGIDILALSISKIEHKEFKTKFTNSDFEKNKHSLNKLVKFLIDIRIWLFCFSFNIF